MRPAQRMVFVDDAPAVAQVLGENIVISSGDRLWVKRGVHEDIAKLPGKMKSSELHADGFGVQERKKK